MLNISKYKHTPTTWSYYNSIIQNICIMW